MSESVSFWNSVTKSDGQTLSVEEQPGVAERENLWVLYLAKENIDIYLRLTDIKRYAQFVELHYDVKYR